MAAKTTVKIATLTGAAKDELLSSAISGLTEDQLSANLNVMSNDPGSAKLYSLLQDPSAYAASTQFPVITSITLHSGATISANPDGTVTYNASALNLQSYALGQTFTDTFVYTIRMGNGALSSATATVEIAGLNDAPTLTSVSPLTIQDTSQAATDVTIMGQLSGSDVDNGAILTYSFSGESDYGTFTLDSATGAYSFVANAATLDALVGGQTEVVSFAVGVTDEHGASAAGSVQFSLVGADEAALVNPVTAFHVNHGLTDVNGRVTFLGFDDNDVIMYSKNYVLTGITSIDTDGDGANDSSAATFLFSNGNKESTVEVVVVGYMDLTVAQIV